MVVVVVVVVVVMVVVFNVLGLSAFQVLLLFADTATLLLYYTYNLHDEY